MMDKTLQPKAEVIENPPRDPNVGFDLRVDIYDAKTGKLIKHQPYVRHAHRDKGVAYEREGKFFYENGEPADPSKWGSVSQEPKEADKQPPQAAQGATQAARR